MVRPGAQQGAVSESGDPGISLHKHIGWLNDAGGTQSVSLGNFHGGHTPRHPIPVSESSGEGEGVATGSACTAEQNSTAAPIAAAICTETPAVRRNEFISIPLSLGATCGPQTAHGPALMTSMTLCSCVPRANGPHPG